MFEFFLQSFICIKNTLLSKPMFIEKWFTDLQV